MGPTRRNTAVGRLHIFHGKRARTALRSAKDNRVAVGLHVKRARVYVCDRDPLQEEGGRQQQSSAFVRRPLLAASRREFHLFARRNEMALIVWRVGRGGAGKQGPRDDGEREIRWKGRWTGG
ncbi:hypothetical protein EYF80_052328 [Liparis tanakae]|uniref:Uncharacterized protein n=1 Tax=Liparis tanakae TaxID=230148 RepID=A0A4Z2F8E9_9TELE|nr:hypothetical protein EYF80_052328 [Liparis tanakae]